VTLKNQDNSTYATRNYVNLYIPNATPTVISGALDGTDPTIKLKGEFLEQTLTTDQHVMVFGLPFKDHSKEHNDEVAAHHEYDPLKQVGFFTNDNWAREDFPLLMAHANSYPSTATVATDAGSQRNNKYVYHNKIYYLYTPPAVSPSRYAVVLFDEDSIDEPQEEPITDLSAFRWGVYDLSGRLLRTKEAVMNGTWRRHLPPGMYIVNGRKLPVK
ncbi:MAG: hypothetical protein IJT19_09710, partial [Bacteroidaceae bacterium]|nr:hypothetical protein [Bacteroidaceae bacterium]